MNLSAQISGRRRTRRTLKPGRRGSFLFEAMMACVLLGAAISMLLPGLHSISRQRQLMKFEALATIVLNNMARFPQRLPSELMTAVPGAEVPLVLPEWFVERYRDASFTATVLPSDHAAADSGAGLQAVRLTITGTTVAGTTSRGTSLVIWIDRAGSRESGADP